MNQRFTRHCYLLLMVLSVGAAGCSVEASKATPSELKESVQSAKNGPRGAAIEIEADGPADTVRVFYKYLREKKFREAILLTNLRPAIEGLTDSELQEFDGDFEVVAENVPAEIQINGEIVTGDKATVTANLPDGDGKMQMQQLELKRDGDSWVILSVVDEVQEKKIKAEGKNYFYNLRIETHESEAREMLNRISKAELVYALQNNNLYGDIPQLVAAQYLPDDAQSPESTGYKYTISVSADKKSYSAKAEPAAYGRTGKLTFMVELNEKKQPHMTSKDYGK